MPAGDDLTQEGVNEYFGKLGEQLAFMTDINLLVNELGQTLGSVISTSTQLNKTFLQGRERIEEMQYAIAEGIPGVMRLGGEISDVGKTIGEIAQASRRNVIANTESVEKLYAATQLFEGQSAKRLTDIFANIGISFDKIGKNLEESISYVQSIGGNASDVMTDVFENTERLNQFNFANGVQGLTKMAAQASMLRFDMRETFNLAEEALNPERAVELSSAFQRLGVMSGTLSDPFQLMNQSINDPEGLQNSIVQMTKQFTYFDEKTKSFKINPQGMLTLREIQKQTGLNAQELSKMGLAAAEVDKRLSQISPKITFDNEEDKQYLSNIASMNDQGEYTVNLKDEKGEEYNKRLADVTQEEMNKLIEEQKKGEKPLEELARDQLSASQLILNDVRAIKNSLLGGLVTTPQIVKSAENVRQFVTTASGVASKRDSGILPVKTVRGYGKEGIDLLSKFAEDISSGNKSTLDALKDLTKSGASLFGKIEADASLGGQKYIDQVIKELQKKGFNTSIIEELMKENNANAKAQGQAQVQAIKGAQGAQSTSGYSTQSVGAQSTLQVNPDTRLSDYLGKNAQTFESLSASQTQGMSDMTKKFSDMVNKVQNNLATPAELNEWLAQNKESIEKYGQTYSATIMRYSEEFGKNLQSSNKTPINIDTKGLEGTMLQNMNKYKEEFDSLIKQVGRGEKGTDSIIEYIKKNEKGLKEVGGDFYKGMKNFANEMSTKISSDDKKLSEFNKIVDEVRKGTKTESDLKTYFDKNSKELERIGVTMANVSNVQEGTKQEYKTAEGKSSFIESKRAVPEPVESGKIQGGQSLTQVVQHKVEFGKIVVDVNLSNNFNQLDTDSMRTILDKVFKDPQFLNLFNTVNGLEKNQLTQTNQLSNPGKK